MGKSKTTKSDGIESFANTQDLGDQRRMPQGSAKPNVPRKGSK